MMRTALLLSLSFLAPLASAIPASCTPAAEAEPTHVDPYSLHLDTENLVRDLNLRLTTRFCTKLFLDTRRELSVSLSGDADVALASVRWGEILTPLPNDDSSYDDIVPLPRGEAVKHRYSRAGAYSLRIAALTEGALHVADVTVIVTDAITDVTEHAALSLATGIQVAFRTRLAEASTDKAPPPSDVERAEHDDIPPRVEILAPLPGRVDDADDYSAVVVRIVEDNLVSWRLEFGLGAASKTWFPVASGIRADPDGFIRIPWRPRTLPDGEGVLRIVAHNLGGLRGEYDVPITIAFCGEGSAD